MGILVISVLLLILITKRFSISKKVKLAKLNRVSLKTNAISSFKFVSTEKSTKVKFQSLFSFTKINWIYIVKKYSICFDCFEFTVCRWNGNVCRNRKRSSITAKICFVGFNGFNYYSKLLCFRCISFGFLWKRFYIGEVKNSNFQYIEESTSYFTTKFWSIWLTLIGLAFVFTTILVMEGIAFQLLYDYPIIEWAIYAKTFMLTTLPLIVVSGFTLLIHQLVKK